MSFEYNFSERPSVQYILALATGYRMAFVACRVCTVIHLTVIRPYQPRPLAGDHSLRSSKLF
jgi:hypothetical protein